MAEQTQPPVNETETAQQRVERIRVEERQRHAARSVEQRKRMFGVEE
jgi:hypothetical protein